ncbi:MAG TPA: hypothetical protein VLN58_10725 [Verrucomicrobiae bacterium]|nr:hypothetical protein [Verrucomicrobiae bacterium]
MAFRPYAARRHKPEIEQDTLGHTNIEVTQSVYGKKPGGPSLQ